ncbi:MAG: hypothetical protein CMF18_08480 [Idiomarinaceae bacterium]|nr:hypothetical protein [Idiomarinaceae bacterium]
MARLKGLDDIVFHAPMCKQKRELVDLMARADIGLQILANVSASYHETSPNKFFDYISAGLPVLDNFPGCLVVLTKQYHCDYAVAPVGAEVGLSKRSSGLQLSV